MIEGLEGSEVLTRITVRWEERYPSGCTWFTYKKYEKEKERWAFR